MDKLTKEEIEKRVHEVAGGKGHLTFDEFWIMEKITIDHNKQSPIITNFSLKSLAV